MNFWNNIIIRKYLLIIILGLLSLNSFSQKLIEVKALSGNVSVFVPKNFGVMPMHILEIKYPTSRRPTEALSNKTGTVSLVFNHTTNAMKPSVFCVMMFLKQDSCLLSSYLPRMTLAQDTNDLRNEPTLEPILKNETS